MVDPAPSSIFIQRIFPQVVSGDDFNIQVKQNADVGLGDKCMSGSHINMITVANDVIRFVKAGRCQELLDRKVGNLDNCRTPVADNSE